MRVGDVEQFAGQARVVQPLAEQRDRRAVDARVVHAQSKACFRGRRNDSRSMIASSIAGALRPNQRCIRVTLSTTTIGVVGQFE